MTLSSGQYYPRIGPCGWPYDRTPYLGQLQSAQRQMALLCSDLNDIFTSIEPTVSNLAVYGHKLRNLLLVASTEFEAQCVGVLVANNVQPEGRHFNTNDYIKLLPVFKLDHYVVGLRMFPGYPAIQPFNLWDKGSPTKSLPWYDAYNQTKHNREANFHFATLENVILAVAGCFCMFFAQTFNRNFLNDQRVDLFQINKAPSIHNDAIYIECYGDTLTAVDYPFHSPPSGQNSGG